MIEAITLFNPDPFIEVLVSGCTLFGMVGGILYAGRRYIQEGEAFGFLFCGIIGGLVGFLACLLTLVYAMYFPLTGPITIIVTLYVLYLRRMRRKFLFMRNLKGEKE